jgi:hypothetical protein
MNTKEMNSWTELLTKEKRIRRTWQAQEQVRPCAHRNQRLVGPSLHSARSSRMRPKPPNRALMRLSRAPVSSSRAELAWRLQAVHCPVKAAAGLVGAAGGACGPLRGVHASQGKAQRGRKAQRRSGAGACHSSESRASRDFCSSPPSLDPCLAHPRFNLPLPRPACPSRSRKNASES